MTRHNEKSHFRPRLRGYDPERRKTKTNYYYYDAKMKNEPNVRHAATGPRFIVKISILISKRPSGCIPVKLWRISIRRVRRGDDFSSYVQRMGGGGEAI